MQNVEITFTSQSIIIIGRILKSAQPSVSDNITEQHLTPDICGTVSLPPDQGLAIIHHARETNTPIACASDGSLTPTNAKHSWVITTSDPTHLTDPLMKITGSGTVDGYMTDISSARAELHGQTALVTMLNHLRQKLSMDIPPCHFWCDNQVVIKGCGNDTYCRLRQHRKPNTDLYLTYHSQAKHLNITTEWVQSHQDRNIKWNTLEDLTQLCLSHEAKLNILCDHMAGQETTNEIPVLDMPVILQERWAIYSCHPHTRKIAGHLNKAIRETLNYDDLAHYIDCKHGLTAAKLANVETQSLGRFLRNTPIHQCAVYIKLMHRWAPTQSFLHKQQRSESATCPLCNQSDETHDHLVSCQDPRAISTRQTCFEKWVNTMENLSTDPSLLEIMGNKLRTLLHLPISSSTHTPTAALSRAVHHQNILGWRIFMNGYISIYWGKYQDEANTTSKYKPANWRKRLIQANLELQRKIWEARNNTVHGKSVQDQIRKDHDRICQEVRHLYQNPPTLHQRYPAIIAIPLDIRLNCNTRNLREWLHWVKHQIAMTKKLQNEDSSQLTLKEAYKRASLLSEGEPRTHHRHV